MTPSVLRRVGAALALGWQAAPGAFLARILLALTAAALPILSAWLTKAVLDLLASPSPAHIDQLLWPTVFLISCGIAGSAFPHLQGYVEAQASRRMTLLMRTRLFTALERLRGLSRVESPQFHDRLSLATHASHSGPSQVTLHLLGTVSSLILLLGFVGTLVALNPLLTAVIMVAAIPAIYAELLVGRKRSQLMTDLSPATRREMFYADLLTNLTAAKEIRLFDLGALFGLRMRRELQNINQQNGLLDRREMRTQSALAVLGAVITGGGLAWAVFAAHSKQLTIGDVSILVAAAAGVQGGLRSAITHIGQINMSLLVFSHYQAVTALESDLPTATPVRSVPVLRDQIEFRDVWFRYSEDGPWVLRGASLRISAGAASAIVGLNGAGKSTVVKLLCRFYDPTRGVITWDGIDIRRFPVAELRQRIGTVFQDFMQYELSAAENIGVGDATALEDRQRILKASQTAGSDALVRALPDGYATMLTQMFFGTSDGPHTTVGVNLSGGQWQRIAVARGLMRQNRDLLILDEPSSGLDAAAEHEIHRTLRGLRRGRTSVLISHRLSAVRDADLILVIDDGVVTESGTHHDLMSAKGIYAQLFTLQANGYQSDLQEAPS